MELVTKKDQLLDKISKSNWKAALRIAKTFVRDFNKEQQAIIQIAAECLAGKESFYKQLGVDTTIMHNQALNILNQWKIQQTK